MSRLNLGCGSRFRPDWTNLDFDPAAACVQQCDLRKGIPFPEKSFDVVYHSHVLEHFPKAEAPAFLRECFRVLRPGGVLRVAVPDLEQIARDYLRALEGAAAGDPQWQARRDWMTLELYDQVVRDRSGGEMGQWLASLPMLEEDFVLARLGPSVRPARSTASAAPLAMRQRVARKLQRLVSPAVWRERLIRLLLGGEYAVLQVGRFRERGEVHRWMYDRVSLARLLRGCGFGEMTACEAVQSRIVGWAECLLDTEPDGTPYKRDSLYMEAIRPV